MVKQDVLAPALIEFFTLAPAAPAAKELAPLTLNGFVMGLLTDFRYALRSLFHARGLTITVILTLALGIGANAAIFSVVRGVLLKPLVNDDEERLIYIRQTAMGRGTENANLSVPEINDFKSRVKTITEFGDFSTVDFTLVGLGEPRVVRAGVVGGSFFRVMGLQPIRGRLIDATDDGADKPQRDGADASLLEHDRSTATRTCSASRSSWAIAPSTIIGVLEPSVPYPAETELIANVVTSSHHMSATMQDGRVHRMTELFGRLAPGRGPRAGARRAAGHARRHA